MQRLIIVAILSLTLADCGGNSSAAPAPLLIQLSPPAPTLAVGTHIQITAQTTPSLPEYYGSMSWSIQGENPNICTQGLILSNPPDMTNCPNGVIAYQLTPSHYAIMYGDYYAPNQPGTYQINVQGQIMSTASTPTIEYQGSATATVTVTPQ